MDQPITIGLDLAKSIFQVHGVNAEGRAVVRRQLRRAQVLSFFERLGPCLVGMEACSSSSAAARSTDWFDGLAMMAVNRDSVGYDARPLERSSGVRPDTELTASRKAGSPLSASASS